MDFGENSWHEKLIRFNMQRDSLIKILKDLSFDVRRASFALYANLSDLVFEDLPVITFHNHLFMVDMFCNQFAAELETMNYKAFIEATESGFLLNAVDKEFEEAYSRYCKDAAGLPSDSANDSRNDGSAEPADVQDGKGGDLCE